MAVPLPVRDSALAGRQRSRNSMSSPSTATASSAVPRPPAGSHSRRSPCSSASSSARPGRSVRPDAFAGDRDRYRPAASSAASRRHSDPRTVPPAGHCLRTQSVAVCGDRGRGTHRLRTRFESGNLETLKRLVERGEGMTLLPALAAAEPASEPQRRLVRPFARPGPVRQVRLVQRRAGLKRRHVDVLRRAIVGCLEGAAVRIEGEA